MSTYQIGNHTDLNPSNVGDFTKFYIVIAICTILLAALLILNVFCCFYKYSDYWLNPHTGNRWIASIWSSTPHKQPPLDLTELGHSYAIVDRHQHNLDYNSRIHPSTSRQPLTTSPNEYLELHKRESEI